MRFIKKYYGNSESIISPKKISSIESALLEVNIKFKKGCTTELREKIAKPLIKLGWSSDIIINAKHKISIPWMNKDVALFIQTGNMARYYADFLKMQSQFLDGKIKCAIYILPTKESAAKLGTNHVHYNRVTTELVDVFRDVITVPLIVYGLYDD